MYILTTGDGSVSITPLVPVVISTPASINFGVQTAGTSSVPQFVVLTGLRLTGFPTTLTVTAPSTGFLISTDGVTWGTTVSINVTAATLAATNLYVQFKPGFSTGYSGNIVITGAGQPSPLNIPINGTGVSACNSLPSGGTAVVSPSPAGINSPITLSLTGATAGGSIAYQWQSSLDSITWMQYCRRCNGHL